MIRQLLFAVSCFVLIAMLSLLQPGNVLAAGGDQADWGGQDAEGNKVLFAIPASSDGVHYSVTGTERLTWGPTALAVAPDGAYWIADAVGNRLLRYSSIGKRLGSIDLDVHHVVGAGDIEVTDAGIFVLDIGAVKPRVLSLSFDGKLLAMYDLPNGLGLESGLSGIALGEHGELLVEREGGAYVSELVTAGGALAPRALGGYALGGRLYTARPADLLSADTTRGAITAGDKRVEVRVANTLAGLHILGANSSSFYVTVEEVALVQSAVTVDQTVRQYNAAGGLVGLARVALADQYTPVAHGLALGPNGAVYALATRPDRVEVVRLAFRSKLTAIMPDASTKTPVSGGGGARQLSCLSRGEMLAAATEYVSNVKYLSAANTDGSCAGRVKPHYMGGPGYYSSVPSHWF